MPTKYIFGQCGVCNLYLTRQHVNHAARYVKIADVRESTNVCIYKCLIWLKFYCTVQFTVAINVKKCHASV